MDFDELFIDDVEKLKCSVCCSFLSYFPVYLTKDKRNICGRCSSLEENCIQNEAFETLCQNIKFPCRYEKEGCLERVFAKDIPNHEKTCPFRVVKCPVGSFALCDWKGAKPTLLNHCQDEHSDQMIKDGKFQFDIDSKETQTNVLEHNSALFIVSRTFNPGESLLEFSIFNVECEDNNQLLSCKIEIKANNRHVGVTTVTTSFTDQTPIPVFIDSLRSGGQSDLKTVLGEISLGQSVLPRESSPKKQVNTQLLSVLKCKSCLHYVLPPIYEERVSDEETILRCSRCRKKSPENSKLIRNINLDKIADHLTFPCENEPQGCSFVGAPLEVEKHQEFCPEKSLNCPVDKLLCCAWNGTCNDLLLHVQQVHSEMVITPLGASLSIAFKDSQSSSDNNKIHILNPVNKSLQAAGSSNSMFEASKSHSGIGVSSSLGAVGPLSQETPLTTFNGIFPASKSVSGFGVSSTLSTNGLFSQAKSTSSSRSVHSGGLFGNAFGASSTSGAVAFGQAAKQETPKAVQSIFGTSNCTDAMANVGFSFSPKSEIFKPITLNPSTAAAALGQSDKLQTPKVTGIIPSPSAFEFSSSGECRILIFSKKVFRVNYMAENQRFFCCVQAVGFPNESFMYEVEVIGSKKNCNRRLIMRLPCSRLLREDEVLGTSNSCCFENYQIEQFMVDRELTFKVRVYK